MPTVKFLFYNKQPTCLQDYEVKTTGRRVYHSELEVGYYCAGEYIQLYDPC